MSEDFLFAYLSTVEILLTTYWSVLVLFSHQHKTPFFHVCVDTEVGQWMENLLPQKLVFLAVVVIHVAVYLVIKRNERKVNTQVPSKAAKSHSEVCIV